MNRKITINLEDDLNNIYDYLKLYKHIINYQNIQKVEFNFINYVESTHIEFYIYIISTHQLAIKFKGCDNKIFIYENIPIDLVRSFDEADSKGSFFNKYLKKMLYNTFEVDSN